MSAIRGKRRVPRWILAPISSVTSECSHNQSRTNRPTNPQLFTDSNTPSACEDFKVIVDADKTPWSSGNLVQDLNQELTEYCPTCVSAAFTGRLQRRLRSPPTSAPPSLAAYVSAAFTGRLRQRRRHSPPTSAPPSLAAYDSCEISDNIASLSTTSSAEWRQGHRYKNIKDGN